MIEKSQVRVPAGAAVKRLLQGQLFVLTRSTPCYCSSTQKIPVILPKVPMAGYN